MRPFFNYGEAPASAPREAPASAPSAAPACFLFDENAPRALQTSLVDIPGWTLSYVTVFLHEDTYIFDAVDALCGSSNVRRLTIRTDELHGDKTISAPALAANLYVHKNSLYCKLVEHKAELES